VHTKLAADLANVEVGREVGEARVAAITDSHWTRDRPVMMSSTIPSLRRSRCGSSPHVRNGSTAIDGLSNTVAASRWAA